MLKNAIYPLQKIDPILQSFNCSFIIMLVYLMGVGRRGPDATLLNAIKKWSFIITVVPAKEEVFLVMG